MQAEQIKQLIAEGIPGSDVIVKGEGDHFEAIVISPSFEGLNMVKQHQLVYGTLGNLMQAEIHALALHTYTPEQWKKHPRLQ